MVDIKPELLRERLPLRSGERVQLCESCRTLGVCSSERGRTHFHSYRPRLRGTCTRVYRLVCMRCEMRLDGFDREMANLDAGLEAIARGELSPITEKRNQSGGGGNSERWPAGPFVQWVVGMHAEEIVKLGTEVGAQKALAARLGCSDRRIREYRLKDPAGTVSEKVVARVTLAEGSLSIEDLYPFGIVTPVYWQPAEVVVPEVRRCGTCGGEVVSGHRFCPEHLEPLLRVKAELGEPGKRWGKRAIVGSRGGGDEVEYASYGGDL